ncbi:hypothetical protein BJ508DRAFT_418387 [Ascobolus immersus RN42]|uniref:Uncharacterized protein n=1 Tax=Ascobolus immersus RN42 TaxID=1160509 RepID=A0A3N4HMC2_ASCIM|nr:hypothetical protein BJ508DRAFT_418387 [Ascobolus immersus RN42]
MDETRNSAESLGRSLFCQLLESKDSSTMLTVDFMETFALSPTPAQIWEGIKRLSRSLEVTAYCVIDGIDEAGDWADKLSLHVAELLESCKRLKLILLGRPASLRFLDDSIALTSIEMSSEVIKTSLQIFLHAKIKSVPVVMNAGEDSAGLQQLVVKCLQQKADGMFLWADLMVKDLYSYNSTAGVREAMLSLPTGLAGLYTRLLEKLVGRTNDLDLERFQKTMTLLTMARRPLTEAELNHAFAVLEHSASAQPTDFKSHHTFGLEAVVRRICGDFVAIKSGTVQLVHISVQEFFTETGAHSPNTSSSNSPIFRRFRVDPAAGHMLYVNLSLDYWAVADEALEKNSSTDTQKGDIEISTTEYVDPYAHIHELYPLMGYVSTHFLFHAKHMIDQTFPRSMIDKLRAFIKSKIFFSTLEGILLECLDYDPEILLAFIIRCRAVVRPTGWDAYFAAVFDSDIQRLVRKLLQSIGPLAPEIIMVSHQQELHRRTSLYGPYHLRTVRVFWVGVILKYVLDEFQRMGGWAEAVVVEVAERTSRIISTISTFVDACDGFLRRKPKTESPPCGLEALPLEFKQANWRTFREIDEAMDYIQSTKDLETPNSTSKRLDLLTLVVQLLALVSYGRRLRDEKQFNRLCSLIRDNFRLLPTPVIFEVGSSLYGYHQSKERFERAGEMFHLAQKSMGRTDSYLYGVIQAHYALSHWKRRAASLSINKNSVSTDSAREQAIVCARQASSIIRKYQLPEAVYYSYQIFYDLASFWVMVNGDANDNHLEETHRALSALWEDEQLFGELLLKWETAQGIQGIVDKLWEVHFASHRFEELRNVLQRIQKRVEGAGNKRAANDHRLFFPLGIVTILCGHLVEGKRLLWKAVRCILTHAELDGLSDPNLQLESMARRLKRDTESIDEPRLRRRVFEEIYETRMSKFFRFCMGIIKTFCMDNMFAEASILSDQVAGAWRSLFPTDLEEIGGNAPMAAKNNVYCYRNWGRHINAKLTLAFIHLLQGHEYTAVSLFREIIDVDTRTSYGDIFGTASTSRDHLAIIIFRRGEFREAELLFTDVDYDQCNYKQLGTIARLWGHLVSHWDDHDLPRYTPMPGLLRALNCESLMDRFNTHKEGLRRKEPMHKFCPPEDEVIQGVEHMVAIGYTGIATKFDKVLKKFYLEQIEKKRARRIEYEKLHAYDDPDSRSRYKPTSSLQGWDREKALGLFRQ